MIYVVQLIDYLIKKWTFRKCYNFYIFLNRRQQNFRKENILFLISVNKLLFCYCILIIVMAVCKFVILVFNKKKFNCLILIKSVSWFYLFWCLFLCSDLFGRSYSILIFFLILDIQYAGDIRNLTFMTLKCSKSLSVSYVETDKLPIPYLSSYCSYKMQQINFQALYIFNWLNNRLTPWGTVILEQLIFPQLVT
jgi:hypothetical protein